MKYLLLCVLFLSGCVNVRIKDAEPPRTVCLITNNTGGVLMFRDTPNDKLQLPGTNEQTNKSTLKDATLNQTGYVITHPIKLTKIKGTLINVCPVFDKLKDSTEKHNVGFYNLYYTSDKDLKYEYIVDLKLRTLVE